uniref:Uncharacterized protein n=1 Tax=Anguilla anguilla TaxID=7936 RepID=A0A0E9TM13_ANGAN
MKRLATEPGSLPIVATRWTTFQTNKQKNHLLLSRLVP